MQVEDTQEFNSANFRINKVVEQRNKAMDDNVLLQEQLALKELELRRAYGNVDLEKPTKAKRKKDTDVEAETTG